MIARSCDAERPHVALRPVFGSTNPYGIPDLAAVTLDALPTALVAYRSGCDMAQKRRAAVHFYLDDYRFEGVWQHPERSLDNLRAYGCVLSPDFSLYRDWPLALQQWNVYRNRWCGAYWQSVGLRVVPTVSWSTARSYAIAFTGLPTRSIVSVSSVGIRSAEDKRHFDRGFRAMVERLSPTHVLCYGRLDRVYHDLVPVTEYGTHWDTRRIGTAQKEIIL